MTKLSRDDVLKLAQLSQLTLSDDEIESFRQEISTILQYVEQLQSVNVDDIKPTNQVTGLSNVMRPDEVYDYGPSHEELLKNAPKTHSSHIQVKRMLK